MKNLVNETPEKIAKIEAFNNEIEPPEPTPTTEPPVNTPTKKNNTGAIIVVVVLLIIVIGFMVYTNYKKNEGTSK